MASPDLTSRRPTTPARPLVLGAAFVVPLVTCAVFAAVRDHVTTATPALVLVLLVVAAAVSGDRVAGILAALSGGVWFDFFLTEPYQRFTISDPDDVEVTVLLVLIGVAVTEVALCGHRQRSRAARRSGYLEGVLSTAEAVSRGDIPASALLDVVGSQIVQVLGAEASRFVPGRSTTRGWRSSTTTATSPAETVWSTVDRVGLPFNEEVAIVVRRGPRVVGHFVIVAASRIAYPTREQRRVAVLLADQVAPALGVE